MDLLAHSLTRSAVNLFWLTLLTFVRRNTLQWNISKQNALSGHFGMFVGPRGEFFNLLKTLQWFFLRNWRRKLLWRRNKQCTTIRHSYVYCHRHLLLLNPNFSHQNQIHSRVGTQYEPLLQKGHGKVDYSYYFLCDLSGMLLGEVLKIMLTCTPPSI